MAATTAIPHSLSAAAALASGMVGKDENEEKNDLQLPVDRLTRAIGGLQPCFRVYSEQMDIVNTAMIYSHHGGNEMILADKIIENRKKNGWSQEELAEKLGVSRQSVSKWENGFADPEEELLEDIARYFGVRVKFLTHGQTDE